MTHILPSPFSGAVRNIGKTLFLHPASSLLIGFYFLLILVSAAAVTSLRGDGRGCAEKPTSLPDSSSLLQPRAPPTSPLPSAVKLETQSPTRRSLTSGHLPAPPPCSSACPSHCRARRLFSNFCLRPSRCCFRFDFTSTCHLPSLCISPRCCPLTSSGFLLSFQSQL